MSFFTNNRWLPVITLLLLTANIVTLGFLWTHKNNNGNVNMPPPPPQGAQGPVLILYRRNCNWILHKKLPMQN
ncbi:MAG: hypothetical protein WDM90_20690 [Ferruginibacter sp.]